MVAQQRTGAGDHDAVQRRSNDGAGGQTRDVDVRPVRSLPAGRGQLGRHQGSFADRCIELLARYAPNVPDAIEHRQVLSPLDLERTFGLTGGNIMQGAMNPNQLYCFRPVPGWADHRTPVRGLYLCGAASHPGGGVMGACGKNAAEQVLPRLIFCDKYAVTSTSLPDNHRAFRRLSSARIDILRRDPARCWLLSDDGISCRLTRNERPICL